MKLLHSADWHLDAPLLGYSPEQTALLRDCLHRLPGLIADMARGCDLVLLSGDLFDGPYTRESLDCARFALEEMGVPVFISPGNHDPIGPESPYIRELWPGNVHIFRKNIPESRVVEALDCRVYGAAFPGSQSGSMLRDFQAQCRERWAVGVFHGDPTQTASPYNPITAAQISRSGLDYLALGHIHKGGSLKSGSTLCAWPGCPMGKGFDECGEKGVLIVTLEGEAQAEFVSLGLPRFFDWDIPAGSDPAAALDRHLSAAGSRDFYRITLTGEAQTPDLAELSRQFGRFPNLVLRDRTTAPVDLWASAGQDSLEGLYFSMLRDALDGADEDAARQIELAARISRQLLDGQEVVLP